MRVLLVCVGLALGGIAAACSSTATSNPPKVDAGTKDSGAPVEDAADDVALFPDTHQDAPAEEDHSEPPPVPIVYAHSPSTLYKVDPVTNEVAVVGPFTGGCSSVIDLALDQDSNAYVTTFSGLYHLDLTTAACTLIATGSYPNSLSFVPKGTVDPDVEALVGYQGSVYVRIDTTTGAMTNIGALTGGYSSSGDIVSVIGGGTFLTVLGNNCNDCLLQVDPSNGDIIQNYGSVNHPSVFGLAFWGGTVYGFDDGGQVFAITWEDDQLATTDIEVPSPPPGLAFWGAGSTTSAPPLSEDGGGIPIK